MPGPALSETMRTVEMREAGGPDVLTPGSRPVRSRPTARC